MYIRIYTYIRINYVLNIIEKSSEVADNCTVYDTILL